MTITFNRTREQLRASVLRKLGVGQDGSAASADHEVVYEAMDMRLKEMHRLGTFWRKVTKVAATFSLSAATTSAHAASADILFPIQMMVRDGSLDEPVDIIGMREYDQIEDKRLAGFPQVAMWKGSTEFLLWPVSSTARMATLFYEQVADDTSAGSVVDIDQSMLRSFRDILCYDVGDQFGVEEQRMQRFKVDAVQGEKDIRKLSVERKEFSTVAVDDWLDAGHTSRNKRDWRMA